MRQRRPRSVSPRFMLICEGETEVGYFHYINGLLRPARISVRSTHDRNVAPEAIVKRAIEFIDGNPKKGIDGGQYDEVWAVFDWDNHTDEVRKAIKLADRHGVRVALSNPCFDVWLIWHWKDYSKIACSAKDTNTALRKFWPRYRKGSNNPWQEIHHGIHAASRRAAEIQHQLDRKGLIFPDDRPSSHVAHLMEALRQAWLRTGGIASDCPVG